MSNTSINKNNLAKLEIDKAINNYAHASNAIKNGNNNTRTNQIENLIKQNKENLLFAKKEINNINTQINNKLAELKKKEMQKGKAGDTQ